ncbi:MAG: PDZ domain-containing protein [Fimbriimonadaceae bacterium]|nr:PDZ domain-containing protein [Fimbriimonadaceae bacterium]
MVSAALLATTAAYALAGNQLTVERPNWDSLRTSFVTIQANGIPTGMAACIDPRGYYVANASALPNQAVIASVSHTGVTIPLTPIRNDRVSGFVLLRANRSVPGATPIRPTFPGSRENEVIYAVLPTGLVRAVVLRAGEPGIVQDSKRLIPVSIVELERDRREFANCLFVRGSDLYGKLIDIAPYQQATVVAERALPAPAPTGKRSFFGPMEPVRGYVTSPELTQLVVRGYSSTARQVAYPILGVTCVDAPDSAGAQIRTVSPRSPASVVGLQPGDVITSIEGTRIQNQFDFAWTMLRQMPASTISVAVLRDGLPRTVSVVVGKSED